jgi:hypothetical protein
MSGRKMKRGRIPAHLRIFEIILVGILSNSSDTCLADQRVIVEQGMKFSRIDLKGRNLPSTTKLLSDAQRTISIQLN